MNLDGVGSVINGAYPNKFLCNTLTHNLLEFGICMFVELFPLSVKPNGKIVLKLKLVQKLWLFKERVGEGLKLPWGDFPPESSLQGLQRPVQLNRQQKF